MRLVDGPNAIAVLLRVFLELSVDYYLTKSGVALNFAPELGRTVWKTLDAKLAEVVDILVKIGVPKNEFAAITRSVSDRNSSMHIDLLHRYVHDAYQTLVPRDLIAAWNHAELLFERIWR